MKLSERIKQMRTDRPDEWQMDELARWAESLEALVKSAFDEGFAGGKRYAWDVVYSFNAAPVREDAWPESKAKADIETPPWKRIDEN